jgi:acetyltransferase-like isoleucine patch superfamily enzyme
MGKAAFDLTSLTRQFWFRALYPGLRFGRGVRIGSGVRIVVRDGAALTIGDRTDIEPNCHLRSDGILEIGSDSFIGQGSVVVAVKRVSIGADALIASGAVIRDQDHGRGSPYRAQPLVAAPVSIGSNVWIGANAVVLKGVTVGDNAIIGAGSVVTKSVPEGGVVVGVHAMPPPP